MRTHGSRLDTLAVVLAGGIGSRLDPLTRHVCKPALPFGGSFRSIDFSLSNCINSGIGVVGVATQYKPAALHDHLARAWSSTAGDGARVAPWHAEQRAPRCGYRGTADAVYRNLDLIEALAPGLVLVLAGDHVYKMDYRPMLEAHRSHDAEVTVGCVEVPIEDARHFGVLAADGRGRIERFVEKPKSVTEVPRTAADTVLASMGIYVFDAAFLARVLRADARSTTSRHDFGRDIVPNLVGSGRAFAHAFRGGGSTAPYWRDIGTLPAYWRSHMDLLGANPRLDLDDAQWPLRGAARPPRRIAAAQTTPHGGSIEDSLVAAGCRIAGRVLRSVLFDAVEIGAGASIVNSVILPGARIGAGSKLRGVIVDAAFAVPEGSLLEAANPSNDPLVLSSAALDAEPGRYAMGR
jgi:glucose-1-phosphate adenylyltransferase